MSIYDNGSGLIVKDFSGMSPDKRLELFIGTESIQLSLPEVRMLYFSVGRWIAEAEKHNKFLRKDDFHGTKTS